MTFKTRIVGGVLAAAMAGVAAVPALAQGDRFAAVEIQTTDLGNGMYMLVGAGGNIGLSVGDDGVFMVDDQFAPLSDKIKAAVAAITDDPVKYVINTHWHFDHVGGNEAFGETGSIIVAHENVRKRMKTGADAATFGRVIPPAADGALPVITFTDNVTFHMNSLEARVYHLPQAHTDGDAIIHFVGADVIHMGDIMFNGRYPFIDINSGGSVQGVLAAYETAIDLAGPETTVIPGHGPLGDKAALESNYAMIKTVRDRVAGAMAEGKSLEEIQGAGLLADLNETYSSDFVNEERILAAVYTSLTAGN